MMLRSSLKEEHPLRTRLFVLAFALVVILPVAQSNSNKWRSNQPAAYIAMADCGPGSPTGHSSRTLPGQPGQKTPGGNPAQRQGNAASLPATSPFGLGVLALARSFLLWMGL